MGTRSGRTEIVNPKAVVSTVPDNTLSLAHREVQVDDAHLL